MAANQPPKKGIMSSLYADLLGDAPPAATISAAPVKYDVGETDDFLFKAPPKKTGHFQYQPPIKRPTATKKSKTKPSQPAMPRILPGSVPVTEPAKLGDKQESVAVSQQGPSEKYLEWLGNEEDDAYYEAKYKEERKRQQKMKKNLKKKNKTQPDYQEDVNYDKPYDLFRPNNVLDYRHSEEKNKEVSDWKNRLYAHKMKKDKKGSIDTGADAELNGSAATRSYNPMFAPPNFDDPPARVLPAVADADKDVIMSDSANAPFRSNAVSSPAALPNDTTGEDAYARRMRLSADPSVLATTQTSPVSRILHHPPYGSGLAQTLSSPAAAPSGTAAERAAAVASRLNAAFAQQKAPSKQPPPTPVNPASAIPTMPPQDSHTAVPPSMVAVPSDTAIPPPPSDVPQQVQIPPPPPPPVAEESGTTISREPVRYNVQPTSSGDADPMEGVVEEKPVSSRPPKKMNIAEKIMMSQGWSKGQGLGARGEGITKALEMKKDKRKNGPNVAYIKEPKRQKIMDDQDDDTMPSEVIKVRNILVGVDIDHEIQENNLMQQIGDHFGVHGNIQRVAIWREDQGGNNEVMIKYVAPVSALKAVTSRDSRTFLGNEVKVTYFPAEKFENGEYA